MKRYLIFGAVGPLVGGFLMLFATTVSSGYWTDTNWSEIGKFLGAFVKTLQYSYLFGIVPMLMLGAIDDIIYHIKRISPVVRMLMLGAIGFATASLLYGSRGPNAGALQFVLYGLVGLVPSSISRIMVGTLALCPLRTAEPVSRSVLEIPLSRGLTNSGIWRAATKNGGPFGPPLVQLQYALRE